MTFFAFSGVLNAVSAGGLVLSVLFRRKHTSRDFIFSLSLLAIFNWSIFYVLWLFSEDEDSALLYTRLIMVWATWIPSLYLHHIVLIADRWASHRKFVLICHAAALILSSLSITPWMVRGVEPRGGFDYWPVPGPLVPIDAGMIGLLGVYMVVFLIRAMKDTSGIRREHLKYLFLTIVISWTGGMTNFLLWFNIPFKPWGNPLVFVGNMIMGFAILRYQLVDLRLAMRSLLVTLLFTCLIPGPLVGLVLWTRSLPVAVAAILLLGSTGPWIFQRWWKMLTRAVDILPPFQSQWGRLKAGGHILASMENVKSVREWGWKTIEIVEKILPVGSASLLMRDNGMNLFLVKAGFGLTAGEMGLLSLPFDNPVAVRLASSRSILIAELMDDLFDDDQKSDARNQLAFMRAAVTVPICDKDSLQAVLNIGAKNDGEMFNEIDLDLIGLLARTAQQTLHNIQSGLRKEQQTASWAHDLARPFGPKGSLGEIRRMADGTYGPVSSEARSVLERISLEMDFVRKNLMQVVHPDEKHGVSAPASLTRVFQNIGEAFQPHAREKSVRLLVQAPPEDLKILCDPWLVEHRVIANLVENALRHTPAGGTVEVGFRTEGNRFIGSVRDSGPGIPPEEQASLFLPGVQAGRGHKGLAGLGLFSVNSVLEEEAGRVWVESEGGQGSCFFFELPLSPMPNNP